MLMPLGARPRTRSTPRRSVAVILLLGALLVARTVAGLVPLRPALGVALGGPLPVQAAAVAELMPYSTAPAPAPVQPTPVVATTSAQPVVHPIPLSSVRVPILCYHYIQTVAPTPQDYLSFNLSIAPDLFAQQMALLHVEGATPITPAMLLDALAGTQVLPAHPVVLTFDDGYADFATAAQPILANFGFVATDYVVSGFLGRPGYMTAGQVRAMDQSGMVIGSHTVHHVDLPGVSPAAARSEIDAGKAALEQLLGHPVLDFAYPYGAFNPTVEQLVRDAGFRDAVTTRGGDTQTQAGAFELHRTHVAGAPTLAAFAQFADLPAPTAAQLAAITAATAAPAPPPAVILVRALLTPLSYGVGPRRF